jgi:hypothetical protein
MISFHTTGLTNPTCTRLEPPVTWLAASGSRVKVLHVGGSVNEEKLLELDLNQPMSCNSVIEVTVPRSFAESSLRTLRNKGFTREDIYRMLDKGPWVLSFDISSALPRLFAGLQVKLSYPVMPVGYFSATKTLKLLLNKKTLPLRTTLVSHKARPCTLYLIVPT